MNVYDLKIPESRGRRRELELFDFSQQLLGIQDVIGFKLSSRGWCYQLEGFGWIDKGRFDRVQRLINECRKKGYLPIDFVAEEKARQFSCVHKPTSVSPSRFLCHCLTRLKQLERWYIPDYWEGEEFYIQMLVEKVDLKTLFMDVCEKYHVPIATTKGWSSILQRAEIAEKFKEAESRGQIPVLLYCGDHDPWGLAISDKLRKNLEDISKATGWSTENLIIDRFGLNYDFIMEHNLTWIDNLISGSGKEPDRSHPIVRDYISKYGERKVEANAIVVIPDLAKDLCRSAIEKYLGSNALERFKEKEDAIAEEFAELRELINLEDYIQEVRRILL